MRGKSYLFYARLELTILQCFSLERRSLMTSIHNVTLEGRRCRGLPTPDRQRQLPPTLFSSYTGPTIPITLEPTPEPINTEQSQGTVEPPNTQGAEPAQQQHPLSSTRPFPPDEHRFTSDQSKISGKDAPAAPSMPSTTTAVRTTSSQASGTVTNLYSTKSTGGGLPTTLAARERNSVVSITHAHGTLHRWWRFALPTLVFLWV